MRIQNNIMAMNAYRNYTTNTNAISGNLEKLSSGYKVNRAGDDAAGLAISEKMRAQITGLDVAQKNAQDGISLVQTAEGALTEVHSMLNRMYELANQSANGTYDDAVDRANLQKEVASLTDEINRIADSANFNGIKLLDGSLTDQRTPSVSGFIETAASLAIQAESATPTQGTNTILGEKATTASRTSFSVDLSRVSTTTGTTAGTFTLSIGGEDIEVATSVSSTQEGEALATLIATEISGGTAGEFGTGALAGEIAINGASYEVNRVGSTLTFTMSSDPTTASQIPGNVAVTAAADATNATLTGSTNLGSLSITEGSISSPGTPAYTEIEGLTTANVVDGTAVTFGNETYIFSIGENSTADELIEHLKAADPNGKYIKVDTKLDAAPANATELGTALSALSAAAKDNVDFTVGVDAANHVTLHQKADSELDLSTFVNFQASVSLSSFAATTAAGTGEDDRLTLQIGDTSEEFNQLSVSISDMHASALGIGTLDISKQDTAALAVDAIKAAINDVSSTRGDLGAIQNRLDHTINNLSVMEENIQNAESAIRDTDVAEEMMAYTKNNILIQSAQAMLAQANQIPQGVLQLLG